jgi:hypothetical protein
LQCSFLRCGIECSLFLRKWQLTMLGKRFNARRPGC